MVPENFLRSSDLLPEHACSARTLSLANPQSRAHHDQAEHFVDVSDLNLQETADRVYADRPDILINLNGYTKVLVAGTGPQPCTALTRFCGP